MRFTRGKADLIIGPDTRYVIGRSRTPPPEGHLAHVPADAANERSRLEIQGILKPRRPRAGVPDRVPRFRARTAVRGCAWLATPTQRACGDPSDGAKANG